MNNDALILLAHGDGGALTHELVQNLFLKHFRHDALQALTDAAILPVKRGKLAMTTDSFVVHPLEFSGGNIGKLAVCGTVNDLAVSGARPLYLTVGFLIEEGLPLEFLERMVISMAQTCIEAGVQVVAGDTKVVPRGQLDKLYINTAGVGFVPAERTVGYNRIQVGDLILVNGSMGDHGMTILSQREGFGFGEGISSDCAPLNGLIEDLFSGLSGIRMMRDLTRGGLATSLKEIADAAKIEIVLEEGKIPIHGPVLGAAEMLGVDPLYLANEGKLALFIERGQAQQALNIMRSHSLGSESAIIGEVIDSRSDKGLVKLKTPMGGTKQLNYMTGQPLPRIC